MQVPALDFGLFIAYFVPGLVVLYALSLVSPKVRNFWRGGDDKRSVGGAVMITLVALVTGRIVSIGRVAIIDPTFRIALPLMSCDQAPHRGAIASAEPDYRALTRDGYREAFLLAITNEQRPYQFGGNTAIAVLVAASCWIVASRREPRRRLRVALAVLGAMTLVVMLYATARISHYRFMRAVAALNDRPIQSLDRTGQPCVAVGIPAQPTSSAGH